MSGCWIWMGSVHKNGYGMLSHDGRHDWAHRHFYRYFIGEIQKELTIDHLCRNRQCVNPKHLDVVTHHENIMRSPIAVAAINARKTHCVHGHSLADAYRTKKNHRRCRTCTNAAQRRYGRRKRA